VGAIDDAALQRHALRPGLGETVGEHTGDGDIARRAVGDGGLDEPGADQDIGEVDRPRHVVQRFIGGFAQHRLGTRVHREQLASEPVPAQIDLCARRQAVGIGRCADQRDAPRGKQGRGEGGVGHGWFH
jgi:hypothetical protein